MKIRNLQFKPYAARKPIGLAPDGTFLLPRDVGAAPSLRLASQFALSKKDQIKLALKRYSLEPDFRLGIVGTGILSKREIMQQIKDQTQFGEVALQAEMHYCNELTAALGGGRAPSWPTLKARSLPKGSEATKSGKSLLLRLRSRALFCENTTDPVTTKIAKHRMKVVHPVFKSRGFLISVLQGTNDVRTRFVPIAESRLTAYISGVGHGNYDLYTGHGGNQILRIGHYNAKEVKGKALHFLSCRTAAKLGPDTVKKGAKCYAGYTENFTFVWDNPGTGVNEFLLFINADSTFDIAMAKGLTALRAYRATIQAFNAAIHQVPNTTAATWLTYDRDHFRLHGAGATVIRPTFGLKIRLPIVELEAQNALVEAGTLVE